MAKGVYVGVGVTYTELEYIQSSGTQYIDTGFVPNQDSGMELDFAVNAVGGNDNYLVGQRDTITSKNFSFLVNAGGKFRFGYNTVVNDAGTADANRHTLNIEKNVLSMDGSEVVTATYAAFTGYGNMWICGINQTAGARYGKMKVYSCKLYDNGTLVRDFVPCQSSAGAIGLYDKVEGKFYANAGSGTFTAGTAGETIVTTGIAQKVKKMYVGVGNVARKIKKGYIGVGGVARPFFSAEQKLVYYGTASALSAARRGSASATVGNYALFAGGATDENNYTSSSVVDVYSSSLTRSSASSCQSKQQIAGASNGTYAVFLGGKSSTMDTTARVYAYNSSLTRSQPSSAPPDCYGMASVRHGNYAMFGGGYNAGYDEGVSWEWDSVYTYNTSLTLATRSTLKHQKYALAATTVGGYALFGGGYGLSGGTYAYINAVDAYSSSFTRSTPTALSVARRYLAATNVGDYALFAGGWSGSASEAVDAYNTSLTRSIPTALSTARQKLAATSIGEFAIFAGGRIAGSYSTSNASNVVDVYDKSLTRTTGTALSTARDDLAAATVGNYALFAGGHTGSAVSAVVNAYTVV